MAQMYVIGEDAISCALGASMVRGVLGWTIPQPPVNTQGVTKLKKALPRYVGLASICPVLCIADTDGKCAAELVSGWLPAHTPGRFLLRLAVIEAESWLLADQDAFAEFFGVPATKVPREPDSITDAKRELLLLARRSYRRPIRDEVVSRVDPNKPGSGYSLHLCEFAASRWSPNRAAERSPSLARAVRRLAAVAQAKSGLSSESLPTGGAG